MKKLLKLWLKRFQDIFKIKQVVFEKIQGRAIPCQPWPQTFYVSKFFVREDLELMPLTLGGLLRGVGRNFITMNYWHFMWLLFLLGFLNTPKSSNLSWSHWNWHPLKTISVRKKGV